jgi:hypothetical protein
MKKISYYSGEDSEISMPKPADGSYSTSTTGMVSAGPVLSELYGSFDNPKSNDDNSRNTDNISNKSDEDDLLNVLVSLGDSMDSDGEEALANFTDFLIAKFAETIYENPTSLFNKLIVKIKRADISDSNEVIKKLTKIYSRTILLENMRNKNLDECKRSAYKKVLHRASQYLSEG